METKQVEFKSDLQELYPAKSEIIVPAFAHMLGVMGIRYMQARATGKKDLMIEAAIGLWAILELMNLQTVFLSNATHASIAVMNHMQNINRLIHADLGIDLIEDAVKDKKFDTIRMCHENWDNWYEEAK